METALLLAPDDADVVQQTERLQRQYNELRQIEQLAASKNDMPALLAIESASCELAAVRLDTPGALCAPSNTAQGIADLPKQVKRQQDELSVSARVKKLCTQLGCALAGGDDLKMYFRSCGGLGAAAKCLFSTCKLRGQLTSKAHLVSCWEIIDSCAKVLNEACALNTNGHVLCGCVHGSAPVPQSIAEHVLCHDLLAECCNVLTQSESVAVLLHSLSTDPESRVCVARSVCAQPLSANATQIPFPDLLRALPVLRGAHQVLSMSLLANCVAQRSCAVDAAMQLREASQVQPVCELLCNTSNRFFWQHAASLIGNLAMHAHVRSMLATETMGRMLVDGLKLYAGDIASSDALLAGMTCLYNLALEKQSTGFQGMLASPSWHSVLMMDLLLHEDTSVAQLAISIAARVITTQSAAAAIDDTLARAVLRTATEAGQVTSLFGELVPEEHCVCSSRQWDEATALKTVDAAIRYLAGCGAAGRTAVLSEDHAIAVFLWACTNPKVMDGCAGNAAMCIGYLVESRCVSLSVRTPMFPAPRFDVYCQQ
jgi:hypothetical protein